MTHNESEAAKLEPEDCAQIADLTSRAEKLIDRRSLVVLTGRRLALPMLATFLVSREAMAQGGSGAGGGMGGMMGGGMM